VDVDLGLGVPVNVAADVGRWLWCLVPVGVVDAGGVASGAEPVDEFGDIGVFDEPAGAVGVVGTRCCCYDCFATTARRAAPSSARPCSMRQGVATIYQELDLVDGLSVAENIYLGHEIARAGFSRRGSQNDAARRCLPGWATRTSR
jgi:hypothetical protein